MITHQKIAIGNVQMMAERWSNKLRYIYLQCGGCVPGHDAVAEAFFAAMPSLVILDIETAGNAFPRCSRYLRGSPMEKDTALNFVFPCCDDFQDPMWVDNVEDLGGRLFLLLRRTHILTVEPLQ